MKIELAEPDEIKLQMTAMIDIVFQLLIFFIMTFKVVAMEGDFSVRMPLASSSADRLDEALPEQIMVRLQAGENGNLSNITVDGLETFIDTDVNAMYRALNEYVERKLAGEVNPESGGEVEVEFDIDFSLKYKYTVKGIEAVSGRILPDGSVKKLVQKIKFKDNTKRPL